MKICVIGGTGHIGKFLVPMLIEAGHEVTVVTSGKTPMLEKGAWKFVNLITLTYGAPGWTDAIRGVGSEVLVDILQGDSPELYMAVKDTMRHMIVCGSIWMLGFPRVVPTPAITQGPCPFSGYAKRYAQLLAVKLQAEADGIAFTAIMPPNICGPYKIPLDCRRQSSGIL